jgi:Protein of unknown function (DUF1592)/Protein of unknown function (DUF1588)/Protein of unknown function (DUF1595)/Protein of unknown function (DUF1587)/Protein of unknown function (DUF1585)
MIVANPRRALMVMLMPVLSCVAPVSPEGLTPTAPVEVEEPPPLDPIEPWRPSRPDDPTAVGPQKLRRLLASQIRFAVRDLLGPDAAAVMNLPTDTVIGGLGAIGHAELAVPPADVERYETAAMAAARATLTDPASVPRALCSPSTYNDVDCYRTIITAIGPRALRHPLSDEQMQAFLDVAAAGAEAYQDFNEGLLWMLAYLLQHPDFLYITELGEGDDATMRPLTGYELAARLSFFVIGSVPTDELMAAASNGELTSPTGFELQVRQLLEHPNAKDASRAFFAEYLELTKLPTADRDLDELPAAVRAAMIEETLLTIDDVVWGRNAPVFELFTTDQTFLNDELAAHYGMTLPGEGARFVATTQPPERRGVLAQGAWTAVQAHGDRASSTYRGKFIRQKLFCTGIEMPPNDVDLNLPQSFDDGLPRTTRDRVWRNMMQQDRCVGCHLMMEPLGWAFERMDQYGRLRTHDNGLPINDTTDVDGVPAVGSAGLGAALEDRLDATSCLVRALFKSGVGHGLRPGDEALLYDVDTATYAAGHSWQEAIAQIALSDLFRFVSVDASTGSAP